MPHVRARGIPGGSGRRAGRRLRHPPGPLQALAAHRRRGRRHGDARGGRGRGPGRGLRAEDELLRPRRGHRAVRRGAAPALRAPRGQGRRDDRRAGEDVLRRREHPDARPVQPRLEGELLQVHQRDPQRDRGGARVRPDLDRRAQRHSGGRRLRARAGLRRDRAHRRRLLDRLAARGAAARCAPRHRRPDPGRRQAARPQGPRGPVRHQVRGLPRPHRRRLGAGRRDGAAQGVGRGDRPPGPRGRRRLPATGRRGRHAHPLDRTEDGDTIAYPHLTATLDRDARRVDITITGPAEEPPASAGRAGRRLVPVRRRPRARRPRAAAAHQRAGARHLGVPHPGRRRPGPRVRRAARRARGRLVRARDHPVPQAHVQAARRHQPQPGRRHRAGQLLRRLPRGADARLRPAVHARRRLRGRRPRRRPGRRRAHREQRRPLPDGQRAVPAGVPLLGPRRRPRVGPQAARRAPRRAAPPTPPAW